MVIKDLEVRDLSLFIGPFTRCDGLDTNSKLRFDHFLVMRVANISSIYAMSCIFPKFVFDSFPILIDGKV